MRNAERMFNFFGLAFQKIIEKNDAILGLNDAIVSYQFYTSLNIPVSNITSVLH